MEKIKQIFISVLLSTSILCSQSYTVSVLGYHIADLKKTNQSSGNINFEFHRKNLLIECQSVLKEWVEDNNHDWNKVKNLTSLIFFSFFLS